MQTKNIVEIEPTLHYMEEYIKACRTQPTGDRYALYSSIFNMQKETIDTMEYYGMLKVEAPIEQLENQLQRMQRIGFQTFLHDKLQKLVSSYCPHRTVKAKLFILDEEDTFGREKLRGVSAFAEYDGTLIFVVYPEESVRSTFESTITHEFHHFWRMGLLNTIEENETLLDRLVLEGLAEYFVGQLLGSECQGPFNKALTETQARELWESGYRDNKRLTGNATNPWMFGGENGLPLWAGYSMGYHLVQWYCNSHPGASIEELTQLPSEDFI